MSKTKTITAKHAFHPFIFHIGTEEHHLYHREKTELVHKASYKMSRYYFMFLFFSNSEICNDTRNSPVISSYCAIARSNNVQTLHDP